MVGVLAHSLLLNLRAPPPPPAEPPVHMRAASTDNVVGQLAAVDVALVDLDECDTHLLGNIDTFVLFAAYPRDGHARIAALLDAHPNIVLADEFSVLDESHASLLVNDTALELHRALLKQNTHRWSIAPPNDSVCGGAHVSSLVAYMQDVSCTAKMHQCRASGKASTPAFV